MTDEFMKNIITEKLWKLLAEWEWTPPKPMFNITSIKGPEVVPTVIWYAIVVTAIIVFVVFLKKLTQELK